MVTVYELGNVPNTVAQFDEDKYIILGFKEFRKETRI